MEPKEFLRLMRNRAALLVLGVLLFGTAAYLLRTQQTQAYRATTMVSIGGFLESLNPDTTEIRSGVELARSYAVVATTTNVLRTAIDNSGFSLTVDELRDNVQVSVLAETAILQLTVTNPNRHHAAWLANEIARQIVLRSPTELDEDRQARHQTVLSEIQRLTEQLDQTRAQLDITEQVLTGTEGLEPTIREQLLAERTRLSDQTTLISTNLAQFMAMASDLEQRSNVVSVIEPAVAPSQAGNTSIVLITLLGGLVGAVVTAGLILLEEYFDDTIRIPEEANRLLELPVLGEIPRFGKRRDSGTKRLIIHQNANSIVAEKYRSLRSGLLFPTATKGTKAYVITSPGANEGKTVTVTNLAVVMAAAGMRVLLVDADLRRPHIHRALGIPNEPGLTDLLAVDPIDALCNSQRLELRQQFMDYVRDTPIPNLRVITSGRLPLNPSELLGSRTMQDWSEVFYTVDDVDVILFDTPPALVVADSAILASRVAAEVVFVVRAGHTRAPVALDAKNLLEKYGLQIRGTVLNFFRPKEFGPDYLKYYLYRYGAMKKSVDWQYDIPPTGNGHGVRDVRTPER